MRRRGPLPTREMFDKQQRKAGVRRDMLEYGIDSNKELAARYGVTEASISNYKKEIMKELDEEYRKAGFAMSARLFQMYNGVIRKAAVSFERSKQDDETIRTEYKNVSCKDCKGTGFKNADDDLAEWCEVCDGKGSIIQEEITRSVRGQAGDPRFLTLIKDCIREISKLTGTLPTGYREGANVKVEINPTVDLSGVEDDRILKALAILQNSENLPQDDNLIEGEIVDQEEK